MTIRRMLAFLVFVLFFYTNDSLAQATGEGLIENVPEEIKSHIVELMRGDPLEVLSFLTGEVKAPLEYHDEISKISEELERDSIVDVIVWLRDTQFTSPSYQEDMEKKRGAITVLQDEVLSSLSKEDFRLKYRYVTTNGFAGAITSSGFKKLRSDRRVTSIVRDRKVYPMLAESRQLIRADAVEQTLGITGRGVAVCVADSGIDYTHTDLNSRYVGGYDFVNNDPDPMDDYGHGTHVAGIIASTNNSYKGVAPGASIAAVKVLDSHGSGTFASVAVGIDWCINNRQRYNIKIVSMSIGDRGEYGNNNCPSYFDPLLQNALHTGMLIVAASGNNGYINGVMYPACAQGVIAVGATYDANVGNHVWPACNDPVTRTDQIACFTNRGQNLDVLAPGSIIYSTALAGYLCSTNSGNFGSCSGTSQAAPHVAGVAALLYQINPYLSQYQTELALKATGVSILDVVTGLRFPRVDALGTVNLVRGATPILTVDGEPRIGNEVRIAVHDPLSRSMPYVIAVSLGNFPGISLPDGRTIPLNMGALFIASVLYPYWIDLRNSQGQLNTNGDAEAVLRIPRDSGLIGTEVYLGVITLDPYTMRIASISRAVLLRIRP